MAVSKLDCGIYRITHTPSGQSYIGQSSAMRARWSAHKSVLSQGREGNRAMRALWLADGPSAFAFEVLLVSL